jgi:tetratricopeptide (TPR) repeat protein
MHKLAPNNKDALLMLTKGWAGAGFAFIEDEYEIAVDADNDTEAEYQKARTRGAYERAISYGIELLEKTEEGFNKAKTNDATFKAYLRNFDEDDATDLLWVGQAWLSRVNIAKDDPAIVAELYVGVAMIERSVELDENIAFGMGHTILGAYHARTAMSEMDESWTHFQKALQINGGKALVTKLQLAKAFYCNKGDKAGYEKTLQEILDAGDVLPEQRLTNTISKRRAKRFMGASRKANCGF